MPRRQGNHPVPASRRAGRAGRLAAGHQQGGASERLPPVRTIERSVAANGAVLPGVDAAAVLELNDWRSIPVAAIGIICNSSVFVTVVLEIAVVRTDVIVAAVAVVLVETALRGLRRPSGALSNP